MKCAYGMMWNEEWKDNTLAWQVWQTQAVIEQPSLLHLSLALARCEAACADAQEGALSETVSNGTGAACYVGLAHELRYWHTLPVPLSEDFGVVTRSRNGSGALL